METSGVQNIKPVYVYELREFREEFSKHGWLNNPIQVSKEEFVEAEALFRLLETSKDQRLSIACGRLNSVYLRDSDEDAIIDIAIGLEVILSGDSKTEISYRLANRLALLAKVAKDPPYDPKEVKFICKKMYDYRSRIVHGDKNYEKYSVIELNGKVESVVEASLKLLRFAIKHMATHTVYLNSTKIDDIAFEDQ